MPKLIVAMVVVLIIQTVERLFLSIVQRPVNEVVLHADARMVFMRFFVIGHKKHVTNKRVQTVAHPNAVGIRFSGKERFHLSLRVKLFAHAVHLPRVGWLNEVLLHIICLLAKHLLQEVFVNIRGEIELFAERQAVALNLLARHGQGRDELSQQSVHGVHRNLPDTEETQNMIYAVSVEVFRHFSETFHPPAVIILFHHLPVVSG